MSEETVINLEDVVCENCDSELPKGTYIISVDGITFCDNDKCFYEFLNHDEIDYSNDEFHPERY